MSFYYANLPFFMLGMISFILLVVYFLPTIVSIIRKNNYTIAIFVLNFLLGWSFVAWVIALVWAFGGDNNSLEEKLKKLYTLKEKGFINDEEFEKRKEELINSIFEQS